MVRDLVVTQILQENEKSTLVLVKECGKDQRFRCSISKELMPEIKKGMRLTGTLSFKVYEWKSKKGNTTYLQSIEFIPISRFKYEKCRLQIKQFLNRSQKYQYILMTDKITNNEFVARMLIDEVEGLKEGYVISCEMYFDIFEGNNLNGDSMIQQLVLVKRIFKKNQKENEENEKDRAND